MKIENVESVEFTNDENELTIRVVKKKVEEEKPELPNCPRSPSILDLKFVSKEKISFVFDGDGIFEADILLKKFGVVFESMLKYKPTSNVITFAFSTPLTPGEYTLEMVPTLCKGTTGTKDFTIDGGKPIDPPMEACKRGPDIHGINDVSSGGLTFLFDGDGIAEIGWNVIQNGAILRSGLVTPVHNHPSIQFETLPKGGYTLNIFGTKCKGGSSKDFAIGGDVIIPPKDPGTSISTENPGVLMTNAAGQTFGVINSQDFMAHILPDGRVKLNYPKELNAMDGDIKVYPWLFDGNMSLVKQPERDALTGDGLKLPEGAHHFYLYYFSKEAGQTIAELIARKWPYMIDVETYRRHTNQFAMVILEVLDDEIKQTNEIKTPRSVRSAAWHSQYQLTGETIDLPPSKKMGITKRIEGVPMDHLLGQVSQIQAAYADVNNGVIPGDNTWLTMRTYRDGNGNLKSPEESANELYLTQHMTVHGQMAEDSMPPGDVEEVYRNLFKRLGNVKVEDTGMFADYWSPLFGYGTDIPTHEASPEDLRKLMGSQESARLAGKVGSGSGDSLYYANRAYEYRNRMSNAYIDSIALLLDAKRVYGVPMSLERQYIAMKDRRVSSFGWTSFEGVTSQVERHGVWQRLPMEGGDLIRIARGEGSFEMLKLEVFYALLIGDVYVSWHDNMLYGNSVKTFDVSRLGGYSDWKTQFQPNGGQVEQYNPNNPNHPKSEGNGENFTESASPGHNGGFVGSWIYSQIKNRVNQSLRYAEFSYNGQPGYFNGTKPVYGSLGNAEVSRFGVANAGQHNAVNQMEHRKPMVFLGSGTEGKVAIVINPYAGLTENTEYKFHEVGATINHVGPYLGVYKI